MTQELPSGKDKAMQTEMFEVDPLSDNRKLYVLSLIHISEPTRLGMISYAVFCLKKKKQLVYRPLLEKKKT